MADVSKYIPLAAGNQMPIVGIGTWQISPEDIHLAVNEALDAGYKLIDTAASYDNEQAIGDVLKQRFQSGKTKREDIFIITKAPAGMLSTPELTRRVFEKSLAALQVDYVDLYLIHHAWAFQATPDEKPMPLESPLTSYDHIAAWRVLEQLVDEGKVKAIGIANFNSEQIDVIWKVARIPISSLQRECHLYLQHNELLQFCKERNIALTSYSTLGSPGRPAFIKNATDLPGPLNEPLVEKLAKKYGKTNGQILLRHMIQRGIAVIPKSVHPSRIQENINIFDFSLTSEEMKSLSDINANQGLFNVKILPGVENIPGYPYHIPY